jgi:hypothetical protein
LALTNKKLSITKPIVIASLITLENPHGLSIRFVFAKLGA